MSKIVLSKKGVFVMLFAFTLMLTFNTITALANDVTLRFVIGSTTFTNNGVSHTIEAAPFITEEARTMVPVRFVAEAMGANVEWDGATQTVNITLDGREVSVVVDRPLPGGMGTPTIVEDRTFVPVRFVAENLGAEVDWDGAAQAVIITIGNGAPDTVTPDPEPEPEPEPDPAPAAGNVDLGPITYNHSWAPGWNTDGRDGGSYPLQMETLAAATQLVLQLPGFEHSAIELVFMGEGNNWGWTQHEVWDPARGGDGTVTINLATVPGWGRFTSEGPGYFGLGGLGGHEEYLVGAHLVIP